MHIITLKLLSKAIAHKLRYSSSHAQRTAEFLLDLFGYDDRIIDNVLDPEHRQLFYLLQTVGILSNGREETLLYDGREWRTHYWQLERDRICDFAVAEPVKEQFTGNISHPKSTESQYDAVYYSLADDVWSTRKINQKKPLY
jgi:hypothetical protein